MNIFNVVKAKNVSRTNFDLGHEVKMSCQFGKLYPILCEDIIPGDKWRCSSEIMARMAPMVAPVMHNVDVFVHFFFVPDRLVFDKSKDWYTGGETGIKPEDGPEWPYLNIDEVNKSSFGVGTLADYLGIKIDDDITLVDPVKVSVTPFRAYSLIYNEYYRDQNLETDGIDVSTAEGEDVTTNVDLQNRAYEKDYFTSCLPFAQRGGDVVTPLKGDAPVVYNGDGNQIYKDNSGADTTPGSTSFATVPAGTAQVDSAGNTIANLDPNGSLEADLSQATNVTINEFRTAWSVQKWLERMARGGSRYIEQMLSMFGVKSSDARLQRPEYLGGGKTPVMMSEVLQTSASASDVQTMDTPLAEMAGHGISVGKSNRFERFFEEHGQIIGIMSILPKTAYYQGIRRQYQKFDRYDKYWPDFANLGEQEIFTREIYTAAEAVDRNTVFGYQPRYIEYKFIPSSVSGEFRTNLDFWHMARKFASQPVLNKDFVTAKPEDVKRNFAITDTDTDDVYVSIYHNIKASRKMPYLGTPMLEV